MRNIARELGIFLLLVVVETAMVAVILLAVVHAVDTLTAEAVGAVMGLLR